MKAIILFPIKLIMFTIKAALVALVCIAAFVYLSPFLSAPGVLLGLGLGFLWTWRANYKELKEEESKTEEVIPAVKRTNGLFGGVTVEERF